MGAGHAHALYVHEHSPLHRLSPHVKIVATFATVVTVAVTPSEAGPVFGVAAAALLVMARVARVPLRFVAARLVVVAPFLLMAATVPFVASGQRVEVLGVHLLIGVGEGVITGLTVVAVLGTRPDLVTGARDLRMAAAPTARLRPFALAAVAVALVVAAGVAQFAVDDPDGLERVAEDTGFADAGRDHRFADGPFADYATAGVADEAVSLALAGIAGTLLTLAVGGGLFAAVRGRPRASGTSARQSVSD